MQSALPSLLLLLLLAPAWANPHHISEAPLAAVSDLTERLASRANEPRLPLPTPADLDAIKKVAQILAMLGEQVIPTLIGDSSSSGGAHDISLMPENTANDMVNDN